MNKCIRMGITASNLSFGEVNRRFYGRKLRFTAPLTRRRKTKFPTVKPPIYLPKCQIWKQLSPNKMYAGPVLSSVIGLDKNGYQVNIFLICPQKLVVGTH